MSGATDPNRTATVVGGGPAGLMAAQVLAEAGFAVAVYEHKPSVGRKFLLAGRGGLNITHSEPHAEFVTRYGESQTRLESALATFGPAELRAWCADLGEPTFIGSSGRVFPQSFRATPLLRAWLRRLIDSGVEFRVHHRWLGFGADGVEHASRFAGQDGIEVTAQSDVTVMALGGASWPRVGSDGGWVDAFALAGIEVAPLQPANCGVQVRWTATFADRFAGQPLKNVGLSVDGCSVRGDCVITAEGVEGGPVYAHSKALRDGLFDSAHTVVRVDLQPDLSVEEVGHRLAKRRPKESDSTWLRKAGFAPVQVGLLRESTHNRLPKSPHDMAELAKSVPITVDAMMPIERAISTAGGVSFDELDDNLMLHKLPGVFIAGEMLDWEAPTGGYLLQGCFSTAVLAAKGAVALR